MFRNPKYVPALTKEQVIQMAMVARKHAEPVGSHNMGLTWLNTWNNWAETTKVEPTANLGPKYPAGNYQFDMLEVVREVFGVETISTFASIGQIFPFNFRHRQSGPRFMRAWGNRYRPFPGFGPLGSAWGQL